MRRPASHLVTGLTLVCAARSETYFLNVLQPVMSVASQFIHWEQTKKGTRLELVLSSQYNVTEDTGKPSVPFLPSFVGCLS